MGIAEKIGGLPSLTAVMVILTGVVGAVAAPALLEWLRIRDDAVKGFAIGVAAHGIGTARAFQISTLAGAFSGLAIGLNRFFRASHRLERPVDYPVGTADCPIAPSGTLSRQASARQS